MIPANEEKGWHFVTQLTHRVPQTAVDELWLAGLLDTWTPPIIAAEPSKKVMQTLIHSGMSLRALAACVSEPAVQQQLASSKIPAATEGLQHNPFLDVARIKAGGAWLNTKVQALASVGAVDSESVAELLIANHLGRAIATELDNGSELATVVWHKLRRPTAVSADLRFAVLSLVSDPLKAVSELMQDPTSIIDWRCSQFVADTLSSGLLSANEVVCRFTRDHGWSQLPLELPAPPHKVSVSGSRAKDLLGTYEALNLIDPVMASREILTAWVDLPQSTLVEVVSAADVETVCDWLSGETGSAPQDDTVDLVLTQVPSRRFRDISKELSSRPGVFADHPHLAGFANPLGNQLPPAAVSVVASRLVDLLGGERERWMFASTLLRNGWTGMLDELGELAAAM